jgi:hypothetical protein
MAASSVCTPMLSRRLATWCRRTQVGLALGMSSRIRRIGPVAFEHVAHAVLGGHPFAVHAGVLIGDGQGV